MNRGWLDYPYSFTTSTSSERQEQQPIGMPGRNAWTGDYRLVLQQNDLVTTTERLSVCVCVCVCVCVHKGTSTIMNYSVERKSTAPVKAPQIERALNTILFSIVLRTIGCMIVSQLEHTLDTLDFYFLFSIVSGTMKITSKQCNKLFRN